MKNIKKVLAIAQIEKKNTSQEMNKFLRHYRATPHTITGKSPAEALYNRPYNTRLPTYRKLADTDDSNMRKTDTENKKKQKMYKDSKANVKPHNMKIGDRVLIRNQGHARLPYDPDPYTVIRVRGHQITAERKGQQRTRDAKKFKQMKN